MEQLEKRLSTGEFGNSPESIIDFCKQISDLDYSISREELNSIIDRNKISRKKWDQLCKVGRDNRLKKYYGRLPSSLTAIYALTTLTYDELNDGIMGGELDKKVSSRKIYAYAQTHRLRQKSYSDDYNILPCHLAIGKKGEELNRGDIVQLFDAVNQTLIKSGLMIMNSTSSTSKFLQKQKEIIAKEKKQGAIETEIESQMYLASEKLNNHYSSEEIYDIMESGMNEFARSIMAISKSRIQMMEDYGQLYCYKIALEFHRSNSRVQRFNYKRRLIHVQQKYKFLAPIVESIFDELIERPKNIRKREEVENAVEDFE